MSRIDAYEYERPKWHRKRAKQAPNQKRVRKESQLAMKLYGGTTDKDKGEPFNDSIDFIGR